MASHAGLATVVCGVGYVGLVTAVGPTSRGDQIQLVERRIDDESNSDLRLPAAGVPSLARLPASE